MSWSCERARERRAKVCRLEAEGISYSFLSSDSGRGISIEAMAPGTDVRMDSRLAVVTLRGGLLATEYIVEVEYDLLLKEQNCCKMENEQLTKMQLEKDAAMKAVYTCYVNKKMR